MRDTTISTNPVRCLIMVVIGMHAYGINSKSSPMIYHHHVVLINSKICSTFPYPKRYPYIMTTLEECSITRFIYLL